MEYKIAKDLHVGDTVTIKKWKGEAEHKEVISEIRVEDNLVIVKCENGNVYHHKSLK